MTAGAVDLPWGALAFRRAGSGPPLVLLHSLALSGAMWEPVLAELADAHDVICPDVRGHGASGWDGEPFTVEDLAEDVVRLLDQAGIDRCAVLGLSMGGSIAAVLAGAHPDRVERLALCDTTAWYGPDAAERWAERASQARSVPRPHQVAFQVDRWFSERTRRQEPAVVGHTVRIFLRTAPRAHGAACQALGALDARSGLPAVTAATLVVTGEEDYATPPDMGLALADAIPGARFELGHGLRHLSVLESADMRRRLLDHLGGGGVVSGGATAPADGATESGATEASTAREVRR